LEAGSRSVFSFFFPFLALFKLCITKPLLGARLKP
jgi:hypothetical protein